MQSCQSIRRIFTATIAVVSLLIASVCVFAEEGEKYRDPDTPKIRASFTTVPDTDEITELRAFLTHSKENWGSHMSGRYKDTDDYSQFMFEKSDATIRAADRMLELCKQQDDRTISTFNDRDEYWPGEHDSHVVFALKHKVVDGFYMNRSFCNQDPQLMQRFRQFVEELEQDPALEEIAAFARLFWFAGSFYNSRQYWSPESEESVRNFQETWNELNEYFEKHSASPYLKHWTFLYSIQHDVANEIETAVGSKVKRGTFMIPTLEFYRSLYAASDEKDVQGWVDAFDGELAKYAILAADDPMAAFRNAVDEKKAELEKHLDEDSRVNLFPLEGNAEDMEQRVEALMYFYTTLRPVFAASEEDFAQSAVMMYDMQLRQLEMIGREFELEAVLLNGTKIDIKDLRGKVVLVDYWATWCGPCLGEMPLLKSMYECYHERGFEIIGLSVDEDIDALRAFVEEEKLPWLNASQVMSLEEGLPDSCKKYDIKAYPTPILIDRDGKVVRADARDMLLINQLSRLFMSVPE